MGKVAKHVEGRSKEARMANRKALGSLSSLTVQPKTKVRYEQARKKFYIFLHDSHLVLPTQRDALDGLLCDYLDGRLCCYLDGRLVSDRSKLSILSQVCWRT